MVDNPNLFTFGAGNEDVYCFIDDDYSAVMTKVVSPATDPVELSSDEARLLAAARHAGRPTRRTRRLSTAGTARTGRPDCSNLLPECRQGEGETGPSVRCRIT